MAEIKDTGKVWLKGSVGPVHAVRVDESIFATGKKEDQRVELWIENEELCIDLHNTKKGERTARCIPINSTPTLPGTLFNGFENTKHADVLIVAWDSERTKEKSVSGIEYKEGGFNFLDPQTFWKTIWNS